MDAITIFRSRFSPIIDLQIEAIKWYFHLQKEYHNLPESLALCVIKDYETLIYGHRLRKDIVPEALRHLSIFNPLSTWDIVVDLNQTIRSLYLEDLQNIFYLISNLKCEELATAIYKQGKYVPSNFHVFTNRLEKYKPNKCDNSIFETCKIINEVTNSIGEWWSLATFDFMPCPEIAKENIYWLLPIFDYEDYEDWETLVDTFGSENVIPLPMMDFYTFELKPPRGSGVITRSVGIYGLFIYYIYAKKKGYTDELNRIRTELAEHLSNENIKDKFLDRVNRKIDEELPEEEKKILEDPAQFSSLCGKSIMVLADPACKKNIRQAYIKKFEEALNRKIEEKIKLCDEYRQRIQGDYTKRNTIDRYEELLRNLKSEIDGAEITFAELRKRNEKFATCLEWDLQEICSNLSSIKQLRNSV